MVIVNTFIDISKIFIAFFVRIKGIKESQIACHSAIAEQHGAKFFSCKLYFKHCFKTSANECSDFDIDSV